jgi:starvation-inducible DNA-binding protein
MKGRYMGQNRINGSNTKLQILIQPKIGLDTNSHEAVARILNITLADEAVLSMKTRSAHWNVHGSGFYDRYTLFDVQYKQLNGIFDEISKRVRVLGGLPIGTFEEFLKNTRLGEQPGNIPDIKELLSDHEASIRFLREDARKCTEEYQDEGTFDLLVSIMRAHEKMAWMLRSYIEPALPEDQRF